MSIPHFFASGTHYEIGKQIVRKKKVLRNLVVKKYDYHIIDVRAPSLKIVLISI
jgi:hypothetical protein